jgi:predicted phage-related endonuclease
VIERHATTNGALHPLRAHDLTASDLAAAIGESPYKTALELYAEKTGHLMPKGETPLMRRGKLLEPVAVAMLREEHPDWDIKYPLNVYLRDPDLRLGATPDALITTDDIAFVNAQIKVVNRREFEANWIPGPPLHYVLQTTAEAMLLDAAASMLVVLVVDYAGLDLYTFDIDRHPQAEEQIRAHVRAFWDNVATGRRPVADLQRDAPTLAALYPQAQAEPVIDLSGENALPQMLERLAAVKAQSKALEAEADEIETFVKDKLGASESALLPGWRIKWPTTSRKAYTVEAKTFRGRLFITKQEDAAT